MRQRLWLTSAVILCAAFCGCKDRSAKKVMRPVSSGPRTAAAPECVAWSTEIEDAAMSGDGNTINDHIDMDAMVDTAMAGVSAPAGFRAGFMKGLSGNNFGTILTMQRKQHCTYRFLRAFEQDGKVHAIFRLLQAGGAVNYHDWLLSRRPDGKVRAIDVYIATSGEYISETFHRLVVMGAAEADPGLLSRLTGADRTFIDHANDFRAMDQALQAGRGQEVLDIYNRLPASLQQEKTFFLYRVLASSKLSKEHPGEYEKAIAEYQKAFSGDPSLDLISLDGAFLSKDYAAWYPAADQLVEWTGGDAHLEGLRANVILLENKPGAPARAEKVAREAIVTENRLLTPHFVLVKALALQGLYAEAVTELRTYERMSETKLASSDLAEMNGLADSPEYQAYRSGKAPATRPQSNPM